MTPPQYRTDPQQIHDILIKAAEDVQQGMWCRGAWFTNTPGEDEDGILLEDAFSMRLINISAEGLAKMNRCAEGSIALATIQAGLRRSDYEATLSAVQSNLNSHCERCENRSENAPSLNLHNDSHMAVMESFDAGQHLAEIFRDTAEKVITA